MSTVEFDVSLDKQHLESLGETAPLTGIIELIWNALDADATEIKVDLIRNDLTGIEEIRVVDNGHGIRSDEVEQAFGQLGGSWKKAAQRSRERERPLHGREGLGRFKSASIGSRMIWRSVAADAGDESVHRQIEIELNRGNLRHVTVSDPVEVTDPTGMRVIIDGIGDTPPGLGGEGPVDRLTATFALPLQNYSARLIFDHDEIDPSEVQRNREDYELSAEGDDAQLTIIEWARPIHRALFLCDAHGMPVEELRAGIQAANYEFTAYLQWTGFHSDDASLKLAELDNGPIKDLIDAARDQMREHFKKRARERRREQIKKWQEENVYPFKGEAETSTAQAVRDVFDVVALSASDIVNSAEVSSRRLSLRLIREALEQDPGSLQRVLSDVLDLPQKQLDELSALLDRTPLTSLIATSTEIANRLEFLAGLELLVLDPTLKKHVKERSQLHRILVGETWVFGEEYSVAVDDKSLTSVLRNHMKILGREELAEDAEPVTDSEGHTRIVDLMLARTLPQSRNRREHLVIELKAPNVKVGDDEAAQIKKYATAVSDDPRFSKTEVSWEFIVVSTDITGTPNKERHSTNKPPGLIMDTEDGIKVWALTWGEVINSAQHRMKFVQQHLDYHPTAEPALDYLRRTHEKYLSPEVLAAADSNGGHGDVDSGEAADESSAAASTAG